MAEIKTTIQLRNDTAANWASETGAAKVLKPGEFAVEYDGDKAKLKIGSADGTKSYAELDYFASAAPAAVYQVELEENETDIEGAIAEAVGSNELQAGDIAIVKAGIAGDKTSYTSYVYGETADGSMAWIATDGNYSAQNVYFKNDITLAGSYTSVGNVALTDGTLSAAGQSLEDVMTAIFTKELNTGLKTGNPAAAISGSTTYYEIGSTGSKSVTVSLSEDGKYAYGYCFNPAEPTEGTSASAVINNGTTGVEVDTSKGESTYAVTFDGTTVSQSTAAFTLSPAARTTKAELKAKGTVYHTQGKVPVSNLNKAYPAQRIAAGSVTSSEVSEFRWYIPWYSGFIYGKENKLSTVDVSKLTKTTDATAYNATKPTTATATGSWMQYWLVVPSSYKWVMKDAKDSNNLTLSVSTGENITINYGTEETPINVEYNVYYIDNADPYDTVKITWAL